MSLHNWEMLCIKIWGYVCTCCNVSFRNHSKFVIGTAGSGQCGAVIELRQNFLNCELVRTFHIQEVKPCKSFYNELWDLNTLCLPKLKVQPRTVWLGWLLVIPQTERLRFNPQSEHVPGLWVGSPVKVCMEGSQPIDVSLPLFFPFFPLSKIKIYIN